MESNFEEAAKQLIEIGKRAGTVQEVKGGIPFTIVPVDCKLESLEKLIFNPHNERPERKTGTVKVLDAASFCEYWRLFSDASSRMFADETTAKILGILDYHESAGPRWCSHRIDFTLRHSEEWKRWKGSDGKKLSQVEFGEFIEVNNPDIVDPPAAAMLDIARDMEGKADVSFGSAQRQNNGSVRFSYSEEIKATVGSGRIEVPEQFVISIPIHIGSARVSLTARLRYRINAGKLVLWYDLLRADVAEREGFAFIRESIETNLATTSISGSPAATV